MQVALQASDTSKPLECKTWLTLETEADWKKQLNEFTSEMSRRIQQAPGPLSWLLKNACCHKTEAPEAR